MFNEYAIDPAVINNTDRLLFYHSALGISKGRMLLKVPKKWRTQVFDAMGLNNPGNQFGQVEKKRIQSRVDAIIKRASTRGQYNWNPHQTWLQNISDQFDQLGLHAIITEGNEAHVDGSIAHDNLAEASLWDAGHSRRISRIDATEIIDALRPLIRISQEFVIVDPHWDPGTRRHQRLFFELLKSVDETSNGPTKVGIVTGNKIETDESFLSICNTKLAPRISQDRTIYFIRRTTREMHNRYFITDRAIVQFGDGIEEDGGNRTHDILNTIDENIRGETVRTEIGVDSVSELEQRPGVLTLKGARENQALPC